MTLKAKLSADEHAALDPSLKAFYKQSGDGFLLDAEGVEDVTGLKSALDKERSNRRSESEALRLLQDRVKDLDLDKAREMLQAAEQNDVEKLIKAGKLEEVIQKRTDKMRRDHEAELSKLQADLKAASEAASTLTTELGETLLRSEIAQQAPLKAIRPTAIPDVIARARGVYKVEEKKLVPYKPDGSPFYGKIGNKLIEIPEWLDSLQEEAPHFFEASKGTGTPAGGGRPGLPGQGLTLSRDDARDPAKYRAAQAAAEKAGVPLSIASA
jgi:hypothetical protein